MVLVVGGAGFIGSHVCRALALNGHKPICLDNFSSGHRSFVKWGPLIEVDLLDLKSLEEHLKDKSFDAIVHLAAKLEVRESLDNPLLYFSNNVIGSINLFKTLEKFHRCVPIIFSSTAAVYGEPKQSLITEDHPKNPINPYGTSKHLIEEILSDLWVHKKWPSIALRYFNVAGSAHQDGIGESHEPESHLIPRLLMSITDPNFKMQIFGTDHPTPDGSCVRDYVHVTDLANAHVKALEYIKSVPGHHRMNIGYCKGFSVKEIISSVNKICDTNLKYEVLARRPGEPATLVADASLATNRLNWVPQYSENIDAIIADSWQWHTLAHN